MFIYQFLNLLLYFFKILSFRQNKLPNDIKKILIYRVGNIGDIICAIPSMAAVKENFPRATIILLSSPGKHGALGSKELLENAEFLDRQIVYYYEDIRSRAP